MTKDKEPRTKNKENAMPTPPHPQQWNIANQRRVALIEKRFTSRLTDHELEELQHLQDLADRQLEELDATMLNDVAHMETAANKILRTSE